MNWFNVFKTEIAEIKRPKQINVGKLTLLVIYLNSKDEVVRGFRTLKGYVELNNEKYEIVTANDLLISALALSVKYGVLELSDGKLIPRERIREMSATEQDFLVDKP